MEHIVQASATVMVGTQFEDNWVFYHDALTQACCKDTIRWMTEKGILHRWLLPKEGLNAGTRYSAMPTGNSPEMMPWDCSFIKCGSLVI